MFFTVLKSVFDTFGAPVFVPVVIFIIALFLKVTPKKAFMSALSAGVGLMGFSLVIGAYGPIITPVINSMVTNSGINLPVFDAGWQAAALVAYSTEIGMIFVGVAIIIQTALFLLKVTNVFQPGDLWNNYSYMLWGSMVYIITKNIWLGFACMILQLLYTQMFAEMIQKRWSKYYQYPGCTIASLHTVSITPYAIAMDWVLNKLGLNKIKADPVHVRTRLGFIGEPMTLGLFLGIFIGIMGNLNALNTLAAWGTILYCGIATSAVMAVFPKISSIFAGSFSAITEASKKSVKGTAGQWYLSVNDAAGYGESATLITGLVLMPIIMIVAFILPGNRALAVIDLVAIPYLIQPIVAVSNGNIAKSVVSGIIWFAVTLLVCTWTAPMFTSVALSVGFEIVSGVALITSFAVVGQPIAVLIFLPFMLQNYFLIALAIIGYIVFFVLMRKFKPALHDYLEKTAELGMDSEE